MAWADLKGGWTRLRGHARVQWGKLTDDQLDVIEGRRDLLLGKLQETYGLSAEEADRQVRAWEDSLADGEEAEPPPAGEAGTPR